MGVGVLVVFDGRVVSTVYMPVQPSVAHRNEIEADFFCPPDTRRVDPYLTGVLSRRAVHACSCG